MYKQKDEHERLYVHDDEDSRVFEEVDENEKSEDIIARLKGTIGRGDCLYCGATDAMVYEGHVCFICEACGKSTHEDIYYLHSAGHDIQFDD